MKLLYLLCFQTIENVSLSIKIVSGVERSAIPDTILIVMKKIKKKKSRVGVDEYGRIDLHYAALENDLARVRQLIASGIDVNAVDEEGFSPLHFAVQANHKDMVRTLLDYGATVDVKDRYGNTPLMRALDSCYAAMAMDKPDPGAIIKILLQAGADPNSENNYGVKIIDAATECDRDLKQFFDQQK